MARDPLAGISTLRTPQSQPIPGRQGQVKNNAGGYVFKKEDRQSLEDFLVLGVSGGSYHMGQSKMVQLNSELVLRLAREAGTEVVKLAVEMSTGIPPRVPKNRGCLFALAAVSAFGDPEAVQAVKAALPQVARTTDHLAMFFGYRKQLKGKPAAGGGVAPKSSRAFNSTLAGWFASADPDDVAFRACKARQRKTPAGEPFALRDAVRLGHPKKLPAEAESYREREVLLRWLAGKLTDVQAAETLPSVAKFTRAQAVTTDAEAVEVVTELRVPWEFLPSERLSSPAVWEALAETTGITAVIRNLARMTRIGTLKPFSPAVSTVVRRLTSQEQLAKGRVHPMDLYLALMVYKSGFSQPHSKADPERWVPIPDVLDALEAAWELSFGYTPPSGKRVLVAVDSSSSMTSYAQVTQNGAQLGSAYTVANSIALMLKRVEGSNAHVIDVDLSARQSRITRRTRLAEVQDWHSRGGGTDLALPMEYAMQYDLQVDGFVLLSDMETWAGRQHPVQALEAYRARFLPHARFAAVAMVPNEYTLTEPGTRGVLNMAGLDSSLPVALNGFFRTGE